MLRILHGENLAAALPMLHCGAEYGQVNDAGFNDNTTMVFFI